MSTAEIPKIDLRAVYKDWPKATPEEARICRDGGSSCCRCKSMVAVGINPYTMEPEEEWDQQLGR